MRGYVPGYSLVRAQNLSEALELVAKDFKPFAGGTDLMVLFESGKLQHKQFVSINHLSELKKITVSAEEVSIGACVTYDEIQSHQTLKDEFPLLVKSAWVTGAKAIQNRGTLGGNIANMSPAADSPPSLLAYDAKINLLSQKGRRTLDYAQFHLGYKKSELRSDELIESIILKRKQKWSHQYFRKIGTRAFQAISKTALSGAALVEDDTISRIHLGLVSVSAAPIRATHVEKYLIGKKITEVKPKELISHLENDITPHDDIRSTAEYRLQVTANLIMDFVSKLSNKPGVFS